MDVKKVIVYGKYLKMYYKSPDISIICQSVTFITHNTAVTKHFKYYNIKSRGMNLVVFSVETMGIWCDGLRKTRDPKIMKLRNRESNLRKKQATRNPKAI